MRRATTPKSTNIQINTEIGEDVAIIIILLWLSSLIGLLAIDLSSAPLLWIVAAVWLRSFLHTGLFITTHEAIHGVINTQDRKVNDFIGSITSWLYALLPYKILVKNHQLHHRFPASEQDPDFHKLGQSNFLLWYGNFMKEYLSGRQAWILLIGMTVIFCTFLSLHIAISNIFLFWVIPILISSLQLFTFGIFLPHRNPNRKQRDYASRTARGDMPERLALCDRHKATSSNYSVFWSFIACYHFDYHWEHHQYPHLPWYSLPIARQQAFCHQTIKSKQNISRTKT
ncbi:fatty acid desaturase [Myxosarcina sp. GI1]|uniref:fatty acid desaturase n=1 Tax=Myxosarcina sp. GI1 TaxID=1541065 RepID=UPI00068A443C|nr:fatty acid desaturase [Myxosarcina sp. GI1]